MKTILSLIFVLLMMDISAFTQTEKFGICLLDVVPARKTTDDTSEQVTQIIFGDAFKILQYSEDKQWILIENAFDQYQGWIHTQQAKEISQAYFEKYLQTTHQVAAELNGYIISDKIKTIVPIGATLPFYENGFILIDNEKLKFEGKTKKVDIKEDKVALVQSAKKYLEVPYLWGGKSPKGIDCSGFSQMVFKLNGYNLPRDSYQQAEKGTKISLEDAKVGDLAFFQRKQEGEGRVIHVGIYLGDGKIIHADGKVRINQLDKTGIFRDDLDKYSHFLKFLRRID